MKHYYIANPSSEKGFDEVTEAEWIALLGEESYRHYANNLYKGYIVIEDVPEEYREQVQATVDNKVAKWGLYEERPITSSELQQMIEEVL